MADKELILSLSKNNGDFVIQPFKASGAGGQKRNKTMSCCRIIHPDSGAVAECTEERSFYQNRSKAFEKLCKSEKFQTWLKIKSAKKIGIINNAEEEVDKMMHRDKDFKVEVQRDGKWVEVDPLELNKENNMKLNCGICARRWLCNDDPELCNRCKNNTEKECDQ